MQAVDLRPRANYAWTSTPRVPAPLLEKVRFIGPVRRGNARIRWESGEFTGLEDWVQTRELICRWKDRKACVRDREHIARLEVEFAEHGDRIVADAISHVLTATGEEGGFVRWWRLDPAKADRLWVRAGLRDDARWHAQIYTDRDGQRVLGYRGSLAFAKAFANAEPEPCLHLIDHWEEELRARGYLPGDSFWHQYLAEERPALALVRQWAGANEVAVLKDEVKRLQQLVLQAAVWLEQNGDERHARALERALGGQ